MPQEKDPLAQISRQAKLKEYYDKFTPAQLVEERRLIRMNKEKTEGLKRELPSGIKKAIAGIPLIGTPLRRGIESLENSYNKQFDEFNNDLLDRKQITWDVALDKISKQNHDEIRAERKSKSIPIDQKFRKGMNIKK